MADTDEMPLWMCKGCQQMVPSVSRSGLCPECAEKAMIENIEAQSQRHRENPTAEP
ncbi:MAG: hypothetical protein ABSD78_19220 [Acidimicrobiales bacterium]|jgi:predicted amidophosphoribosyltransferase